MRRLAFALAALLLSLSASAQFAVIGGLTSSSASVKDAIADYKNLNQFHLGVAYKFSSKDGVFAAQPAFIYNVKGGKLEDIKSVADLNLDYKTGYLEVPVQLQVGFGLARILRIYGCAEPFVGFAVHNEASSNGVTATGWDNVVSRFEYGLGLGGGVEIFKHFQISLRYFWNFGTIYGTNIKESVYSIGANSCNGIILSGAVLF